MINRVFGVICLVAVIGGIANGKISEVSCAVFDGASGAVELTVSLVGIMCLWCGVVNVLREAGIMRRLAKLISPLIRIFFPEAYRRGVGSEEICANISANLLGIGNAATPMALKAMEKLQSINPDKERASGDMITLAVLNTSAVSLLPTTIIALRRAAGSTQPYAIVVPVWICSLAASLMALVLTRLLANCRRGKRGMRGKR